MDEKVRHLREIVSKENTIYLVDTKSPRYNLIPVGVTIPEDETIICEGRVPENYVDIFRTDKLQLEWNDATKTLQHKELKHFVGNSTKYGFGYNKANGKLLRKKLIEARIAELYYLVEQLIILKNTDEE